MGYDRAMATLVNGKGTDVPKSMSAARDTGCKLFNYEAAASEVTAVQLTVGDKPYRVVDLDDGTTPSA